MALEIPADLVPSRTGTSVANFTVGGAEFEFTAGPRDLGHAVAAEIGIELTESYRLKQGLLLVGTKQESWSVPDDGYTFTNKHTLAVWVGANYSIHSHLYDTSMSDVLALFARFSIDETADGARMVPKGRDVLPAVRPETVMVEIPTLGLVIVRKRAGAEDLPDWPGSTVEGGEAYCDKKDEARPTFLLATDSAVATVIPDHAPRSGGSGQLDSAAADDRLRYQQSIDLLSVIKVGWT